MPEEMALTHLIIQVVAVAQEEPVNQVVEQVMVVLVHILMMILLAQRHLVMEHQVL
tara:strand:- start:48 stop:215 length:168 start_codon:yes stop_codon:yes gene_type:complete